MIACLGPLHRSRFPLRPDLVVDRAMKVLQGTDMTASRQPGGKSAPDLSLTFA
jgi:hypothetical protein